MINVRRYRVYPTREQGDVIFGQFRLCTELRNHCLDTQNFDVRQLPVLKKERSEFKTVHSTVLQNLVFQIRDNIKALSSLKKKGHRVGRLRHKPVRSLVYEGSGFKVMGERLWLSKIGDLRIVLSRLIPGVIKQIVLKFTQTHKWFVSIISRTPDDEPTPRDTGRLVGIDLNLVVFSRDSDDFVVSHPHNLKKSLRQLGRAQRKLSRKQKGSKNRWKAKMRVRSLHETIQNRRDDFLHKWSTTYVFQSNYSGIAVEKLNIKDMLMEKTSRAQKRNILDAAWLKARTLLRYKAERAGIVFKEVDPAYTTQSCSSCGHRQPMPLKIRTFSCPSCGSSMDRDLNAARNILQRAFGVGWGSPEFTPAEVGPSIPRNAGEQDLTHDAGISRL